MTANHKLQKFPSIDHNQDPAARQRGIGVRVKGDDPLLETTSILLNSSESAVHPFIICSRKIMSRLFTC